MVENVELVRLVAHMLTSANGRRFMDKFGYESSTPIISAYANEHPIDVIRRLLQTDDDVMVLAVWFPQTERLLLLRLSVEQVMGMVERIEDDSFGFPTVGLFAEAVECGEYAADDDIRVAVYERADYSSRLARYERKA